MGRFMLKVGLVGAPILMAACSLAVDVQVADEGIPLYGSGFITTEMRRATAFHGISVHGAATVTIQRTGRETLRVTADDNLLPHFETAVRDGILYLGPEEGVTLEATEGIAVTVEVKTMDAVDASGAVVMDARLGAQPSVSVALSGASSFTVTGAVERLDVALSGASRFAGRDLEATAAEVSISGASLAVVWARRQLKIWASGASLVRYLGSPTIEAHATGMSRIEPY